jgi:hypothetical protein
MLLKNDLLRYIPISNYILLFNSWDIEWLLDLKLFELVFLGELCKK